MMTKIVIAKKVLCLLFLAGNLVSCMSSAIMQTAKPLEKKEVQINAGVGVVGANYTDEDSFVGAPVTVLSHIYGKVGLGSRMDIGLRGSLAVYTHIDLDWKYNFYSSPNNRFYASTGLMISTGLFYNVEDADRTLYVPIYLSWGDHDKVSFYVCQRVGAWVDGYRFWSTQGSPQNLEPRYSHTFAALSGGFGWQFGADKKRGIEISYLYGTDFRYRINFQTNPDQSTTKTVTYDPFYLRSFQVKTYWSIGFKGKNNKEKVVD